MTLDPRLFPVEELRRSFGYVLGPRHADLLNYADAAGYLPLREFVATRLQRHGVTASAEDVLITNGSQQGLTLVVDLLVDEGDEVIVENPTFHGACALLRARGAHLVGVPMRSDGMALDHLLRKLKTRRKPAFIYTIPSFHNPTGTTTSPSHRERLLRICEQARVPLVEDGFQEEFTYFDQAVRPIKAMDRVGSVIYLGSFSKTFVPGLRLGYVVAHPDLVRTLSLGKYVTDLSCSPILQAALCRCCLSGAYERHLRRMNREFMGRMRCAIEALEAELPRGAVVWDAPKGGYLIWLRPTARTSEGRLLEALERQGVRAAPGRPFYANGSKEVALRLSISSLDERAIREGVRRIGLALRELGAKRPPPPRG
jgi:GntR family transcriptional regulator/MocR family aminotransferase